MTTCAEWKEQLAAAEADLQAAIAGGGTLKSLQHGDKRMEYAVPTIQQKQANVRYLAAKVASACGTCGKSRFIRFTPSDG